LQPGGLLVCSGFDRDEQRDVENAFGLDVTTRFYEAEWISLILVAQPQPDRLPD
jgi:ribosomal protein L11 methylase PrmA